MMKLLMHVGPAMLLGLTMLPGSASAHDGDPIPDVDARVERNNNFGRGDRTIGGDDTSTNSNTATLVDESATGPFLIYSPHSETSESYEGSFAAALPKRPEKKPVKQVAATGNFSPETTLTITEEGTEKPVSKVVAGDDFGDIQSIAISGEGTKVDKAIAGDDLSTDTNSIIINEDGTESEMNKSEMIESISRGYNSGDTINTLINAPDSDGDGIPDALMTSGPVIAIGDESIVPINVTALNGVVSGNMIKRSPPEQNGQCGDRCSVLSFQGNTLSGNSGVITTNVNIGDGSVINSANSVSVGLFGP